MLIRIYSVEDGNQGKSYYIKYKRFLFWHTVWWDGVYDDKIFIRSFYKPIGASCYFHTYNDAEEFAFKHLQYGKRNLIKEMNI